MSSPYDALDTQEAGHTPSGALFAPLRADPASIKPAFSSRPMRGALLNVLADTPPTTRGSADAQQTPTCDTNKVRINRDLAPDEGFERAQRIAGGGIDTDDFVWLKKGFSAFLAARGALPLERCLGLPRNDSALRRACRDYWLRRAWKALGDDLSPWRRSEKLAAVVRSFRSRQWARWRTLEGAPSLVSEVEFALFEAFRSSERIPQTAMQLHNIAHHRRHS